MKHSLAAIAVVVSAVVFPPRVTSQGYRLERIAAGLNQPTYVTQAPGDPANILYYTERTDDANPGFSATNNMGSIWRYDVQTASRTQVFNFDRFVTQDTGLIGVAFHPDFNVQGASGFGKMYVTSAEASATAVNRVEEFDVDISGPSPTYQATPSRLLLEYDNNQQLNHTINWIGFDPTATGSERDYLYISTGDGSYGNAVNGGQSPNGRPSQNPSDIAGKMLRVDVMGADAYPADDSKNFAIPASNPIPAYNAANPGTPITGLGEAWLTGLRNVYRASFDSQTGDLWMGDVGETTWEEVNFLKAGTNTGGPPIDYGWPEREGTIDSGIPGSTGATVNPFTGAVALNPLQQFPHDGGGEAVIGGYLYRGPVAELQGKYFYADFPTTGDAAQVWSLEFDRDTPTGSYNGDNGVNTDISALWQSLVVDPADPSYQPDSTFTSSAGLDHIVSFGTDNAGNLYLVDFGNGQGFFGQYPGAGAGEIFRVTPTAGFTLTVNRDTGEVTLVNDSGAPIDVSGYSLTSLHGAIDPDAITPIAGRLDASPGGDGSVDPDDVWQVTSAPDSMAEFAESTTGAATLADQAGFELSAEDLIDGQGLWVRSIYEDLQLTVTVGGVMLAADVEFVGNGGQPFARSDLNFNGEIDPGDWTAFKPNHLTDLAGLTAAETYRLGDLDGDGDNDYDDFLLFRSDYIGALGAGAFQSLLQVPEPSGGLLTLLAAGAAAGLSGRRRRAFARAAAIACCVVLASTQTAQAVLVHQYTFNDGTASDLIGGAHGALSGDANIELGVVDLPGDGDDFVNLPGGVIQINDYTDATFEAWFSYRGGGAWQRVFDFGSTNFSGQGRDYLFFTPNSGAGDHRAAITDNGGGGDEDVAVGGPTLNVDEAYHVAVVVDDTQNNRLSVYINGQLAGDTFLSVSMDELDNDNAYLGRSNYNADDNLNGAIDEFRIYNHALSAQEVLDSFTAGPVPLDSLGITVNTVTGGVTLSNANAAPIDLNYYRVSSAAGALNAEGWVSLDEQGIDSTGPGEGESWDELGEPGPTVVSEAYLLAGTSVGPGSELPLGNLFDPSVFGAGADGDLQFRFGLPGAELQDGDVTYVTPDPLDGDFNDDGQVDAADYTVWRDSLGSTTDLTADGDGDGVVDNDDYLIWRWGYGAAAESVSQAAAPEPAAVALSVVGLVVVAVGRGRSTATRRRRLAG
ncbi:hypothetical protein KOR34_01840 [Posidoniimonas corsicana]|uniref:Glucose/Sorbosone dehydrogenase domain-containing protein n=1 Tax=Posidoniimonas corsicana TaxID=1938618 RepID=A0A5C5V9K8_9BACT|nr:LamG-like jellyroll fold domain-containing protein [Posidoniimonas corsicana]TWT35296.1 hypothetical protein KOR34_01840 [Posidoniimonas corsicana]